MSCNAHEFKRDVIDQTSENEIFKRLSNNLSYYFFSHLSNIELIHLEFPILMDHLYDFVEYYGYRYNGNDINMAYSNFYSELSKTVQDTQKFVWNCLYSISIYMNDSEELQSIVTALEADKESCQFLIQVRKVFADISSIPLKETYLDMLPVELSKLHLYFSAIYGKNTVRKMPL